MPDPKLFCLLVGIYASIGGTHPYIRSLSLLSTTKEPMWLDVALDCGCACAAYTAAGLWFICDIRAAGCSAAALFRWSYIVAASIAVEP